MYGLGESPEKEYKKLVFGHRLYEHFFYDDNFKGRIAWNQQYFMNSLLNMYLATKDFVFLKLFVELADHLISVRDDRKGRRDVFGRSLPGWQAASYYTLGIPRVLLDRDGAPSLLVQGINKSWNNAISLRIESDARQFSMKVVRKSRVQEYNGLTMENVESRINRGLSPNSLIRVHALSSSPPKSGSYRLAKTYPRVFIAAHNALIVLPLLRFAFLQKKCQIHDLEAKAHVYLKEALVSIRPILSLWVNEEKAKGYIIFEPTPTYWAAGLPLPYNLLAANGLAFLYGYLTTGGKGYFKITQRLARKILSGISLDGGTVLMHYWYGLPSEGWNSPNPQLAVPFYTRGEPISKIEDLSHFFWTLWFILESHVYGIFDFSKVLNAIRRTVKEKILLSGAIGPKTAKELKHSRRYLSKTIDGQGEGFDYSAAIFAALSDKEVFNDVQYIYFHRYTAPQLFSRSSFDVNYLAGVVLLGWSILARNGRLGIQCKE